MFFRMIKRDLRRRKSMNLILLVFVFLVSAFISASVGNILSITGALDHFFEVAQVPDSVVLSMENDNGRDVGEALRQIDEVQTFAWAFLTLNLSLGAMALVLLGVLLYVRQKILKPFDRLTELPYELSKGNLNAPIQESKSR